MRYLMLYCTCTQEIMSGTACKILTVIIVETLPGLSLIEDYRIKEKVDL